MSQLPELPKNFTPAQKAAYDALLIQEGACNPTGIAHGLMDICKTDPHAAAIAVLAESVFRDGCAARAAGGSAREAIGVRTATERMVAALSCADLQPATRLVIHQLAWIVFGRDYGLYDSVYSTWNADMDACRDALKPTENQTACSSN